MRIFRDEEKGAEENESVEYPVPMVFKKGREGVLRRCGLVETGFRFRGERCRFGLLGLLGLLGLSG